MYRFLKKIFTEDLEKNVSELEEKVWRLENPPLAIGTELVRRDSEERMKYVIVSHSFHNNQGLYFVNGSLNRFYYKYHIQAKNRKYGLELIKVYSFMLSLDFCVLDD